MAWDVNVRLCQVRWSSQGLTETETEADHEKQAGARDVSVVVTNPTQLCLHRRPIWIRACLFGSLHSGPSPMSQAVLASL